MAWRKEFNPIVQNLADGEIFAPAGKIYYMNPASGSDGNDGTKDTPVKTLGVAIGKCVDGKNDTIVLEAASSGAAIATNLAWSKNNITLTGTNPGKIYHGSAITQTVTCTPMVTISGSYNVFKNIWFQHGIAAADLVGIQFTSAGNYNSFYNCHFQSPFSGELEGYAMKGLYINGAEGNYFNNCVFGSNWYNISSTASLVHFGVNCGVTVFDNCVFIMRAMATTARFIYQDNSSDTGAVFFRGCTFYADEANGASGKPAAAIVFGGSGLGSVMCDQMTMFCNVSAIGSAMTKVYLPTVYAAAQDHLDLIANSST